MACSACKIGMRRPPRRGGILAPFIHRVIKTKLPRYIHPGWVRVDCGVLVRKQTRHQAVLCERSSPAFSCLKCSSRVNLDLQASRIFRPTPHTKTWSNVVLSYFVRTWPTGLLLRSRVNAPCLERSRCWRSRRKANVSRLEWIRASPSKSSFGIMRLHCDDRRNEVQSQPAPAVARACTCLWIQTKLSVHAPCLDSSRFWRSRQGAHALSTCSCCGS